MQIHRERTFGERLREARMSRGMSLRDIEERGGPNKNTMSALERSERQPYAHTIARIARALGVDPGELGPFNPPTTPHGIRPGGKRAPLEDEHMALLTEAKGEGRALDLRLDWDLAEAAENLRALSDDELAAALSATGALRALIRAELYRRGEAGEAADG